MKGKDDTCNDQVYLLLWWWYLFLTIMGLLRLLQRVGLLSSSLRLFLLLLKLRLDFDTSSNGELVKDFIKRSAIGDWFVLYQMSRNMNRRLFFMFLTTLAKTPKWELRQVIPQINVVNAFKSSVKNKSKGSDEKRRDKRRESCQGRREIPEERS